MLDLRHLTRLAALSVALLATAPATAKTKPAAQPDTVACTGVFGPDSIAVKSAADLKDVAKRYCQGRIVSCLEGGYNLSALARSVEAHLRVLADV